MQDLIAKGLLQYAKAEKEVMGVDADPFPDMDVNVITAQVPPRPSRWFEEVEEEEEPSFFRRRKVQNIVEEPSVAQNKGKEKCFEEQKEYLCIRCGDKITLKEAVVAEKEQQVCYSKARLRFNTMANGDLQIFVGAKMIYDGLDPGVFGPPMDDLYGPGDGLFLVNGDPVRPSKSAAPSIYDEDAVRSHNWVRQGPQFGNAY